MPLLRQPRLRHNIISKVTGGRKFPSETFIARIYMPEFIVVSEDEPATDYAPVIVFADNASEAIDKYLRKVYAKEDVFREGVLDRCLNMSFAERFFLVTEKEHRDFDRGTYKADLKVVGERIHAYFKDNPRIGEKYFEYLKSGNEDILDEEAFEVIAASDRSGVAALEMARIQRI